MILRCLPALLLLVSMPSFGATFVVTRAADSGSRSFREAIAAANARPGTDVIHFNIGGSGNKTITLLSALPPITDAVTIDGTTEPGFAGAPVITLVGGDLNGSPLTTIGTGLSIVTSGPTVVRGLALVGFLTAFSLHGDGATIVGNYVGITASNVVRSNFDGIRVGAGTGNRIGGVLPGEGNVISGNLSIGLEISGATDTLVQGNFIGTDITGTSAVPNGSVAFGGIAVRASRATTIGGTAPGARNVISGNAGSGIFVTVDCIFPCLPLEDTVIAGNFIGTAVTGTKDLGNMFHGIFLSRARGTIIGGDTAAAGNVISGNERSGVADSDSPSFIPVFPRTTWNVDTVISANLIGTDVTGTLPIRNTANGILLEQSQNTIVGGTGARRNVISGNGLNGIQIRQTSQTPKSVGHAIRGNVIGAAIDGESPLPNGRHGVLIGAGDSRLRNIIVGGTEAGEGNTIRFNGETGILADGGTRNRFFGNSIDRNGMLGIDLRPVGPTPNDPLDADEGANEGQNSPFLTAATLAGSTFVTGTLHSTPGETFRVEFFNSSDADSSGSGEGDLFLGFLQVTTDSGGNAAFAATLPAVAEATVVTATATAAHSTSEFSNAVVVAGGVAPTLNVDDVTVTEGDSDTVNAVFTVSLTIASAGDVNFQFVTAGGTATAPADYTATAGTGTIPAGVLSTTISIPVIGETLVEPDETFVVNITNIAGAAAGDVQGEGTIVADDAATLNVGDVTVTEGDFDTITADFMISLTAPATDDITFDFATADGTAAAPADYTATTGTGTIPAGSLSTTVSVPVIGDTLVEPDETFVVNITNIAGATGGDVQGEGTIAADDAAMLNVSDVSVTEGDSGMVNAVFTVSLTTPAADDVTFDFATADGSATAPADYTATTGTGSIPAGTLSTTISVPVIGDALVEADETFLVNITNIAGATGGDVQGEGTIAADDAPADAADAPTLSQWALALMALFLALAASKAIR